jgi:hypothetical protein
MKLNVHVLDKHVGVLEQAGDFRSVMAYTPDAAPENLVSLTMPVRTESYPWDDELHRKRKSKPPTTRGMGCGGLCAWAQTQGTRHGHAVTTTND